ncbi:hypothetical protein DFQ29_000272 [Apophysomyces sp. BC1021]|nr:hypothetical protein DFQ29_000272 [Apophysomyces sp. BC1021]
MLSLPPEILMEIFNYLVTSQSSLYAAALVCKRWLPCVAPMLYRHCFINDTYRWATFLLTLARPKKAFDYGPFVNSVDLSSGKSLESMRDAEFFRRQILPNNNRSSSSNVVSPFLRNLTCVIVSTSSLIELSRTCSNLTTLNLSYTTLLYDSLVAETGEYLSTLQYYAIQPGLTHIKVPLEGAIYSIGQECRHLEEVKIQRCDWVTAQVVWAWVINCQNLKRLDARRSTKCTVKRLTMTVLEAFGRKDGLMSQTGSSSSSSTQTELTMPEDGLVDEVDDDEDDDEEGVVEEDQEDTDDLEGNDRFILRRDGNMVVVERRHAAEEEDENNITIPDEQRRNSTAGFTHNNNNNSREWARDRLVSRRPPSPVNRRRRYANSAATALLTLGRTACNLRELVHDILKDAKALGATDLSWFQEN